ncbi:MAG: SDR family NAD(P)-dependent oxidoreductase [Ignavibacteriaceae bacterium]|jgi:3-oxoacyl-[acyl-carrier protein] reductase|nr:MAG: 3-oxoacyl-ACP reductase [Chlorobi bacterium OLB4]MBV6399631.1 3-oxoacyl-[acyl-carrier-protein] reductase FabG [Ignavibacteria bacterium]MCC6885623.1 SDR family oxidoreductase [Ignavibacteriales bacterium]MCE7953787.1 SDR family oxidoreductase [Chlorobi bacterium CHB7]MDL1887721.1 SDR family oxidoreductase [Ignavibacteria bacterium CHB1]MEB2330344.1 SDR family NAD(P)-dependent oxidoreductase [Ignavibacteriaceae bacterium]OQY76834.1 MAG: hypothetical protein B6D43_09445 [Ignavibacterial
MLKPTAIVTGGVRRLGGDISLFLLKNGFRVISIYNSSDDLVKENFIERAKVISDDYKLIRCDLRFTSEIVNCFDGIFLKYPNTELLVNNAAIFEKKDFLEIDEEFFDKTISINLKAVFFCSQLAVKYMLRHETDFPKRIINISSIGAFENWSSFIPYSISKAGVVKFTEQLAKRFAPKILVNSIAPGIIMIDGDMNENVNLTEIKKYPMKRFGKSDDITALIGYLTEKNNFITGQTIKVDGGRTL